MPPLWGLKPGWGASADPSRLALVIGNSAYANSPLANPTNDAKAVAGLLTDAGFAVSSHLNAKRDGMLDAIDRFGNAVRGSDAKLVVFYYAGHGAQHDWRNYLLPVDTSISQQDDIKRQCVELNHLIGLFGAAKDKTYIVILDACRDDPFGAAHRPEQKGLSQFDAPAGSLLAYATAPGSVAADGVGQNGLYTEKLVRELSQRGTRIEDALKRVRLNVRLASKGTQVPWETTSLESDVFIFNDGQKKLSDSELEKLIDTDVKEWNRIKSSHVADDWVGYLRRFPNGRFAEIAQLRLTRILASIEIAQRQAALAQQKRIEQVRLSTAAPQRANAKPATVVTSKAEAVPAAPTAVPTTASAGAALDISADTAAPVLLAPSANPFSAGRYPLGRVFTVGDEATFRVTDLLTGAQTTTTTRVTKVDYESDRVEFDGGQTVRDLMGNSVKNAVREFDAPLQVNPSDLQIGKKWSAAFRRTKNGTVSTGQYDLQVVRREKIVLQCGNFDAFLIEGHGWRDTHEIGSRSQQWQLKSWLVPGLNFPLIFEEKFSVQGRWTSTESQELISLRQQVFNPGSS